MRPESGGQNYRQARHELRNQRRRPLGESRTEKGQPGVRATERGQRLRNGQRPVLRDPVAELEYRPGVAQHDELRRVQQDLPRGKPGADRYRADQAPPGGPGPRWTLRIARLPHRPRPAAGHAAEGGDHQDRRQRHRDQDHRDGQETPGQQQRNPRQQPADHQQRRNDREPGKAPASDRGRGTRADTRAVLGTATFGCLADEADSQTHGATVTGPTADASTADAERLQPSNVSDRFIPLALHDIASR